MKKPTDREVITELFRDRGIDFNNANGNLQYGNAELVFDNNGKLIDVSENPPEEFECSECEAREEELEKVKEDAEKDRKRAKEAIAILEQIG